MIRPTIFTAASAALLLSACSGPAETEADSTQPQAGPPDAGTLISEIRNAMGIDDLQSITYSGYAWQIRNSFQQTRTASPPWVDRDEIINYVRTLDLGSGSSLASGDTFAQNLFFDPQVHGEYLQHIQPDQSWRQRLEIYLTPWGFLHGADSHEAEVTATDDGYRLSWSSEDHHTSPSGLSYTVSALINDDNLITRTETRVENPFMGDMLVANELSEYDTINGMQLPTLMEQQRGGGTIFGVHVREAAANPANLAELMQAPETQGGGGFGAPPASDQEPVIELAEGVLEITGGYHALVTEFSDHLVVFEAGMSESRGETLIQRIRDASDKPIRYVINSHPHSDHTAGLVPFVREGVTIITHELNVDFLDMALSTPRTLLGEDTLDPQFRAVGDGVTVLEDDDGMRLELHHVPNWHSEGMLVAVVPERGNGIMFQADFSLPLGGAEANPFVVTLAEYVRDNDVQFEQYRAVHPAPAPQTKADLMAALEEE